MTKIQIKFYNMLKQQIVDYEEIFHKDFMIQRIQKIADDKLKFLLEDINSDKDNFSKKGYITYAKFVHYADKFINKDLENALLPKLSKIDKLFEKRALLLKTIENQTTSISQRNELIENIKNKVLMFKENGKNILDQCDYYIIDRFGFYNFFDENRNYHIKEELEIYLKEYTSNQLQLNNEKRLKLKSS